MVGLEQPVSTHNVARPRERWLQLADSISSERTWLHKGAFRDAIALRYGWLPTNYQTNCACGSPFSVEHALSCCKGGFSSIRHNAVRDTIGSWMSEVCNDVFMNPLYNHSKERCFRCYIHKRGWGKTRHCSKWILEMKI